VDGGFDEFEPAGDFIGGIGVESHELDAILDERRSRRKKHCAQHDLLVRAMKGDGIEAGPIQPQKRRQPPGGKFKMKRVIRGVLVEHPGGIAQEDGKLDEPHTGEPVGGSEILLRKQDLVFPIVRRLPRRGLQAVEPMRVIRHSCVGIIKKRVMERADGIPALKVCRGVQRKHRIRLERAVEPDPIVARGRWSNFQTRR
jgi:hypothetical protein